MREMKLVLGVLHQHKLSSLLSEITIATCDSTSTVFVLSCGHSLCSLQKL